ncbi:MAG: hypothetical protein ABIQ33_11700 [Caldimonas sp.]
MTEQTERRRAERRQTEPETEEDLSPEYLALLEVCGGEIRASDRALLAERRKSAQAEAKPARAADQRVEVEQAALPSPDRRRSGAN